MKFGHVEAHQLGANPATLPWRLRGAMSTDPGVVVIVSVGVSVLIALGLLGFALWYLESRYTRKR